MQWTRIDDELSWTKLDPLALHGQELADAGFRTLLEVRRSGDRHVDFDDLARSLAIRHLVVDGWPDRVFEEFRHQLQTGEPGPVLIAAHHEDDARLLAWIWRGLRERRSFDELSDRARRDRLGLPAGAWSFLASQLSPGRPSPM